jgi:hypothetical protein
MVSKHTRSAHAVASIAGVYMALQRDHKVSSYTLNAGRGHVTISACIHVYSFESMASHCPCCHVCGLPGRAAHLHSLEPHELMLHPDLWACRCLPTSWVSRRRTCTTAPSATCRTATQRRADAWPSTASRYACAQSCLHAVCMSFVLAKVGLLGFTISTGCLLPQSTCAQSCMPCCKLGGIGWTRANLQYPRHLWAVHVCAGTATVHTCVARACQRRGASTCLKFCDFAVLHCRAVLCYGLCAAGRLPAPAAAGQADVHVQPH